MKPYLFLGLIGSILSLSSCTNSDQKMEEKPPIEMNSALYKQITEVIAAEGVDIYNQETGDANFDVYCVEREEKSLACVSALGEPSDNINVRSFVADTDTIFFAYVMKK